MSTLAHIADRVINRPLLIMPEKAAVIVSVLAGRIGLENAPLAPEASRFEGDQPEQRDAEGNPARNRYGYTKLEPFMLSGSTALVSVVGSLVNRGAWIGASSGLTSYEGVQHQLKRAAASPDVKQIVLDLHSPGGEAIGAFETGALVRAIAAEKPVTAVVNGMAASAAYAIASGASRIVTTETGVSGSIGVVLLHADYSRQLANDGITPTLIFAGAHKVDGNPFQPLPDGVKADLQAEVNAFYEAFLRTVAQGRGAALTADMARATEARTFVGQAAVDAGLADAVGTFESVLADLSAATTSRAPSGRSNSQPRGMTMSETKGAPAQALHNPAADAAGSTTTGITQAQLDQAVAEAEARGRAAAGTAATEAVAAERSRLAALDELAAKAGPGARDIIAAAKADGKTTAADAALAIFKAGAHRQGQVLGALADDDASAKGGKPAAEGTGGTSAVPQTPEGWKAEWEGSEALQAEFATAAAYVGYRKAEKRGNFRVLGNGKAA